MTDASRRRRFRAFVREYPPGDALGDAWAEHRLYVGLACGLFVLGIGIGVALAAAGYDLLEIFAELFGEELLPDVEESELTARFFVFNNSIPFLLSIVGAVTLGLYTAWIMVFNGVVVGNLAALIAGQVGVDYVLVGLAPHGIFELTALFVAAGVGFRLLHRLARRVLGRREAFLTRPYVYRTAILVAVGWLLLVLAAVIEAHVTPVLLETLFAERIEEAAEAESAAAVAVASRIRG